MANRKGSLPETAQHLNSAAIHLLRGMRAVDRRSGLTPARLSALSVLVFGGASTLGRLAEAEDVAGSTMTRIVDGLVDLGLAARESHPDSGRQVLISATREGEAVMRDAAQRRFDVIVAALRALPTAQRRSVVTAAPALVELAGHINPLAARRATGPE